MEAAVSLLADESVTSAIGGADAAEDFAAVCAALGLATAHPAIGKGFKGFFERRLGFSKILKSGRLLFGVHVARVSAGDFLAMLLSSG